MHPLTTMLPRNPSARLAQTGAAFGIATVVFIAYAMPLIGFLASLCFPS